ncbi:MAG: transporter substrate-binding domain-containing protein [Hyphomicrobiales bacterium]
MLFKFFHLRNVNLHCLLLIAAVLLAGPAPRLAAQTGTAGYTVPHFRHVELDVKPPKLDRQRLVFLADQDFPPFSYADASGAPKGLAVDLALSLCSRLAVQCTITLKPWTELAAGLLRNEADAVISGLKLDDQTATSLDATRPIYRALGRFAVRKPNPISAATIRVLAGKRVGVVKASAHEAWLKRYFPYAQIIAEDSLGQAQGALKDGKIDALFADALSLVYWTEGEGSERCCRLLPGAFVDQDYFSRGFVFFVRRGDGPLKAALDYGLDQLQQNGEWDRLFRAYVPDSPW